MSRRPRPQYRLGLEWILGVAFAYTLTRPVRLAQGLPSFGAAVRLGLLPHTASRRQPRCLTTATTACSCLWLAVATISPREGLSPPIQCPCQAHTPSLRHAPRAKLQRTNPGSSPLRTRQVTIESGRAAKAARRLRLSAAVRAIVSFRVLSLRGILFKR